MSLEQKSLDPRTADYASKWHAKALEIKMLSDRITNYIDNLKRELKIEAGLKLVEGREVFPEDNVTAVIHLFDEKGEGKGLYDSLEKYERDMLTIDSEINNEFKNNFISSTRIYPGKDNFIQTFFANIPVIGALAMLSKFENDTKIMENQFVSYCHNKSSPVMIIDDFVAPLVSQSSTNVKGGDEIEITAGVGAFSTVMKPVISIRGKSLQLGEDGTALYKLKAPLEPGKYSLPVTFQYTKADGTSGVMIKEVGYTVVGEK